MAHGGMRALWFVLEFVVGVIVAITGSVYILGNILPSLTSGSQAANGVNNAIINLNGAFATSFLGLLPIFFIGLVVLGIYVAYRLGKGKE